tara:strand:- start:479 stop:1102 length:624 start_codon:yes stop_codon:yes gene_type:complete
METKQLFLSDVTDEEFNAIYDVVKSINKEHIDYLEIGCNAGGTLVRLLNKSNKENINVHLTGIDLFEDIVYETQNPKEQTHRHSEDYINTAKKYELEYELMRNGFSNKFELIKGYSDNIVPLLDKNFDVIFVDGNHTYKQCKKDLYLSFEKSKIGSYFIFHNAGIEEVEPYYPDGGPYKVCEELKQNKNLEYVGKPTKRVKVFKRIK